MTCPGSLAEGDAPDDPAFDDAHEPEDPGKAAADDGPDLEESADDPVDADEPTTEQAGHSAGGAPQSRTSPEPLSSSGSDTGLTDGPGSSGPAPDEPAGMTPETSPRSDIAPSPAAPDEPDPSARSAAPDITPDPAAHSGPEAAPEAAHPAGMTPEEAPRSDTAPEPETQDDPATHGRETDGPNLAPKGGMSSEAGPQSRVSEAGDQTPDAASDPDRNMTPQRMSPDFGDLGKGAEDGWFDDMTLKFGAGASFQLLGQGGAVEIGFTDTGPDDWGLQDVYVSTSWGVGGGLSASGDLTGGLVLDSSEFEGMAVETGGSGGMLGDAGIEASFPRSESDGSISTAEATGLNTIDISIGVGAGGEAHVRPTNTRVWEVK